MVEKKEKKSVLDSILADDSIDDIDTGLDSLLYRTQADGAESRYGSKSRKGEDVNRRDSLLSLVWRKARSVKKNKGFHANNTESRRSSDSKSFQESSLSFENTATFQEDNPSIQNVPLRKNQDDTVELTREGVTVQLRDANGVYKLKISSVKRRSLSKRKLANIALNAILKELNKEG